MRILPSWLVKEYCHAVLRIRICIKSDNTDLSGFTSFRDNTVILALRMHCRCAPHPRIMHALALRAPTDENFIFLIGKGILQCSIAYPDLHQIKRNDTHQSAISGEHPLKTSGLKRSVDKTSRRPRREGQHQKVRNKEGIDIEINTIRTSLVQGWTTRTGDNKSKNDTQYKRVQ